MLFRTLPWQDGPVLRRNDVEDDDDGFDEEDEDDKDEDDLDDDDDDDLEDEDDDEDE